MAQVESFCVINTHTDPHTLTSSPSHPHPHILTLTSSHTFTQVVIRQLMAQVEQLRAERIPECERSTREMKLE